MSGASLISYTSIKQTSNVAPSCHRSGLRATLGSRDFCALSGYDQAKGVSACGDTGVSVFTREKYSGFKVAGRPLVTNAPPWKRRCALLELTTNDS